VQAVKQASKHASKQAYKHESSSSACEHWSSQFLSLLSLGQGGGMCVYGLDLAGPG